MRALPRALTAAVTALALSAVLALAACGQNDTPPPPVPDDPTPTSRQATPLMPVDAVLVDELKRPLTPLPVICIDPGHPSEGNAGTTVQNGLQEVEVVFDVARLLVSAIEEGRAARTVLTRDFRSFDPATDLRVTNRRRAEIANEAGAALFLRLHCDTGSSHGFAVYYPDREGSKHGHTGPPEPLREESRRAAEVIHATMVEHLGDTLQDNGLRGESRTYVGSRQGALTGSIFSQVPAVTVEMVVLSHPDDAAFIGSEDGQDRMARALADGVRAYLEAREPVAPLEEPDEGTG